MRFLLPALCAAALFPSAKAEVTINFDANSTHWDLSNNVIHAVFQVGPDGRFGLNRVEHLASGNVWKAPEGQASSPVRLQLGTSIYEASTPFRLIDQRVEAVPTNGKRQVIILEDLRTTVRIRVDLELYEGQPVLRHRVAATNLTGDTVYAQTADLLPYAFAPDAGSLQLFRVAQWAATPGLNFQTSQTRLAPDDSPSEGLTGAHGDYCAWLSLRDENNRGLFAGWEFDGQALSSAKRGSGTNSIQFSAAIKSLHHPVGPGETFTLPAAFLGLFQGDWDQAGYRTQRFAESVLAKPTPLNFPYVSWDSWGYRTDLNEEILRRNAETASRLGFELFVVDLGWAREIGNWHEDPGKFPSGLRALSDYVHSLGMKFGLHFALAEAAADAPVLQQNPDWTVSDSDYYFGALSLCLSNKATRDWLVQEAVRMIDEYAVDYILQDGENMVKRCNRTMHTHDPEDSNFSNAVDGINAAIAEIQRQRPGVIWENCENGGNMMTFNMVQQYVTSITSDASGALGSRQGVWGATYPFSPRFADRYMPENPTSTYITRSYMFGGPWHFMNQLASMPAEALPLASAEIQTYKRIRGLIRDGQVFHLTQAPAENSVDALESYSAASDSAVAVVTRDGGDSDSALIRLEGLYPDGNYTVRFQDDSRVLSFSGRQLIRDGVRVNLPRPQSAEIVYVEPMK
jgi:hypothetical protein